MAMRLRHQILVRGSYFILIKFDSDNTDISVRTPRSRRSNIVFCEFRAFLIGVGRTQKKKGKERKGKERKGKKKLISSLLLLLYIKKKSV